MYKLFLLFTFFPFLSFSQDYNYRAYDKAVKYYNQHQYERSKDLLFKLIDNFSEWKDPNGDKLILGVIHQVCASIN